jgi:hypothetical protein
VKIHYYINSFCFCSSLSFNDRVQLGLLVVATLGLVGAGLSVYFIRKTLIEGKKASDESRRQTEETLAINQYHVYYKEMKDIIRKFQEIKFTSPEENISALFPLYFRQALSATDGMYYKMIELFKIFLPEDRHNLFTSPEDQVKQISELRTPQQILDRKTFFRRQIIRPLIIEYKHLLHFLVDIKNDKLLTDEYRGIFYKKIEFELLQHYFLICNYSKVGNPEVEPEGFILDVFPENTLKEFYAINEFYKQHKAFRYWNLKCYQTDTYI